MKPILEIKDVSLTYDKDLILKDINFNVFENDFIGVIGPNGGGKTTLLKGILGLLIPSKGTITYHFKNIRKNIGYLPQIKHVDRQFPIKTFDIIRSGLIMTKQTVNLNVKDQKYQTEKIIEEMGIAHLKNKTIGELSGGQMQRVFLSRALISEPELLILDEPDTFVDNRFEGELYEKLKILNNKLAIILVSHDIGTITSYVKTIACVNKTLHYHPSNKITNQQLEAYNCPIQIITHGNIPHTVLDIHNHPNAKSD